MSATAEHYVGDELELFKHAVKWKRYWQSKLQPYVKGTVLEVGGGLGANTPFFAAHADSVLTIEPDKSLADNIVVDSAKVSVRACTVAAIDDTFDAIFYIDVLEHIEQDADELTLAASRLKPGGVIGVIVPAHQYLYSPFDKSVGHWRRYNKKMLANIVPAGLQIETLCYLDSVGCSASFANRFILGQSMPTYKQIKLWDSWMVPLSKIADPLLAYQLGKTVLAIYKKPTE